MRGRGCADCEKGCDRKRRDGRTAHPNCPFNPLHSRTCNADRSAGGTAHRPETGWIVRLTAGRVKHADPPNLARLLRARRERPRRRRAAEERDEVTPSQLTECICCAQPGGQDSGLASIKSGARCSAGFWPS
jgi:hypothetical protein